MHQIQTVALAHTPFAEKFAIPRQPMLAPAAVGIIELQPPFDDPLALQGLEQVSHIWLSFLFHEALPDPTAPPRLRVRPPRLGGNDKLGVFATRSSHRPNGIGQSLVKVLAVEGTRIHVAGVDLLDQTPIIDIKPYVPYADCLPEASNGIAQQAPAQVTVDWQPEALACAQAVEQSHRPGLVELINQCLAQDPKPAYQTPPPERMYGTRFWDVEVKWHYPAAGQIVVTDVAQVGETTQR